MYAFLTGTIDNPNSCCRNPEEKNTLPYKIVFSELNCDEIKMQDKIKMADGSV